MAGLFSLEVGRALSLLPRTRAVMTAAFEHKRDGLLVDRVMVCADEPPCIAVAMAKGHRLSTLIRDSHSFAINILDTSQSLLLRKFEGEGTPDAFELIQTRSIATGAPCLVRAQACLDCDVMRHFDLEADSEVYVGLVVGAWNPIAGIAPASALDAPLVNGHANGHAMNGNGYLNGHTFANGRGVKTRMSAER